MQAPSPVSIQYPHQKTAPETRKNLDHQQQGALTNAVGVIAKEGFDDDLGIITEYHQFRQAPLNHGLSMLYAPTEGKNTRIQRTEIMGQAYREAVSRSAWKIPHRATHHAEIAQDLLTQVQHCKASYRSQEIMLELVALSLAAAGYNLHKSTTNNRQFTLNDTFPSNSAIGINGGFNGEKRGLKLWRRKDSTPTKVAQHTDFLNKFKKAGYATLAEPIDPAPTPIMQAEQLFHHGKMLLTCTPTKTLRNHPAEVKQLALNISKLDQETKDNNGRINPDTLESAQAAIKTARKLFLN